MEPIFLTCMVIAYFFTKGKVDTAAYASGKESPGVAKARMRHDTGGGARSASGRPKGKGAFRLMMADRWANACEGVRQRGEHKAKRRRAWYAETAPGKDEAWREKKQRRQQRADAARQRWAEHRGLIDLSEFRIRKAEEKERKENERRAAAAAAAAAGDPAPSGDAPAGAAPPPGAPGPAAEAKPAGPETAKATGNPDAASDGQPSEAGQQPGGSPRDQANQMYEQDRDRARKLYEYDRERAREAYEHDRSGAHQRGFPEAEWTAANAAFGAHQAAAKEGSERGAEPLNREPMRVDGEIVRDTPDEQKQLEAAPTTAEADIVDAEVVEDSSSSVGTGAAAGPKTNGNATGKAGDPVYNAAADRLINAAERVEQYRQDLAAMADGLDGKKWGVEVHGPIRDMDGHLATVASTYRDLAGQMQQQGDSVSDSHDAHPYVPADAEVIFA